MSSAALSAAIEGGRPRRLWRNRLFTLAMLFCMFVAFGTLVVLLVDTVVTGWPAISSQLLTGLPSTVPAEAGARPAILATLYLGLLVLLFSVPIGVLTAIYLEEYANRERWWNRAIEVNIQNLAAVPAIVYGILGLAFIVRGIGVGRVVLAGGLILTLVVLPTVVVSSREAIRAVPDSIRQGAFALGATKWQVVWRQVLPASIPGIATGSILALSRAVGETAPSDHGRRDHVRRVQPHTVRPVHRAAGADLQLDEAAGHRLPDACGSRCDRPARHRAQHECGGDLPS